MKTQTCDSCRQPFRSKPGRNQVVDGRTVCNACHDQLVSQRFPNPAHWVPPTANPASPAITPPVVSRYDRIMALDDD